MIVDAKMREELQGKKLAIMEIFSSIQGEGAMMGMPVTFIRLQGCNLDCPFCDTKKSWAKLEPNMEILDIVEKVDTDVAVITGGEPCLQDLTELIDLLHYNNIMVCMETNGTLPIPKGIDWVTCSPKKASGDFLLKTPEGKVEYYIHPDNYDKIGEYKFVVTPDFKVEDIPQELRQLPTGSIWLQPEGSEMQDMWKKAYEIAMEHKLRVGCQLHKLMEVE